MRSLAHQGRFFAFSTRSSDQSAKSTPAGMWSTSINRLSAPDEGGLGQADAVNIWRGVLITAERTFRPDDDVCKLLRMLDKVPGVLEGSQSCWRATRAKTASRSVASRPFKDGVLGTHRRVRPSGSRLPARARGIDPFRTFKFCGVPPAFSQDKPFA